MPRDKNQILFSVSVEDIYNIAESEGRDFSTLTDKVVDKVAYKIEAMDFGNISDTISLFIDEAIKQVEG